jgi:hypothetical protein
MYLKEPTSTDIIKNEINQHIFIHICINYTFNTCVFMLIINFFFKCSDLVYDRDQHDHDRDRYILIKKQ